MISISNLDIFIAKTCNLSCAGCITFSDSKLVKGITPYNSDHLEFWSNYIQPAYTNMFGGEPLINPDLEKWIAGCREYWPYTTISIQTNGLRLDQQHLDLIEKYNVSYRISQHLADYSDVVWKFIDMAMETGKFKPWINERGPVQNGYGQDRGWINEQGDYIQLTESYKEEVWWPFYKGTGTDSKPNYNYFSNDFASSWDTCVARTFVNMYDGDLYKCPAVAGLLVNGPALGLDKDSNWSPYFSQYKRLQMHSNNVTIEEWFHEQQGPQSCCNMCTRSVSTQADAQILVNAKVKI